MAQETKTTTMGHYSLFKTVRSFKAVSSAFANILNRTMLFDLLWDDQIIDFHLENSDDFWFLTDNSILFLLNSS